MADGVQHGAVAMMAGRIARAARSRVGGYALTVLLVLANYYSDTRCHCSMHTYTMYTQCSDVRALARSRRAGRVLCASAKLLLKSWLGTSPVIQCSPSMRK